MGGLFKKKPTADEQMVRIGLQAFGNECAETASILKAAQGPEIKTEDDQDAGIEFELVIFHWLSLMRQSFDIQERPALDGVATRALPLILQQMSDSPRLNRLRKGARWLYRVNDEGTAARLWVTVNMDSLPEGIWRDFSIQALTRLFAHLTVLNEGGAEEKMIIAMGDQATIRTFPHLSEYPFNLQSDLKKAVGKNVETILKMGASGKKGKGRK